MRNLGDRFKQDEAALDLSVPADGFLVVRLDGKAFHTYTRGFEKPFDKRIVSSMIAATEYLCMFSDVPVMFGYTQSDEISLVIDQREGQPWMGGRVQKIASVAASYATAYFNAYIDTERIAAFDGRVLHLRDFSDVHRYLLWRKADANRNAISAVAQSLFPHRELQGKKKAELLDMISRANPDALPIDPTNFNGRYVYPTKVFVGAHDPLTNQVVLAQRTRWESRGDEKMLHTFLDVVDP